MSSGSHLYIIFPVAVHHLYLMVTSTSLTFSGELVLQPTGHVLHLRLHCSMDGRTQPAMACDHLEVAYEGVEAKLSHDTAPRCEAVEKRGK